MASNILQSRYVCRTDSGQSHLASDPGHKADTNQENNMIKCSNTVNLPTCLNFKTAEHLGMRSGYSVSRQEDSSPRKKGKRPAKRRYQCSAFEDEVPFAPFTELPHPKDLFGKRFKSEKKERIKASTVDSHQLQLHQKLVKHDLIKSEIASLSVKEHQSLGVHSNNSSHHQTEDFNYERTITLPEGSTSKDLDFEERTSKVSSCSLYEYPSLAAPSVTTPQRKEKVDRHSYLSFSFNKTKYFEE